MRYGIVNKKLGKFGMSKAIIQLEKFWKNKKVFVTGHTGFKGTWLIIFLNLLKAKIYGFALKAPKVSIFNQTKSYKILKKNYYLNINNLSAIKRTLKKTKPQIIFHLAAQPLVSKSYQDPLNTFSTNIIGTSNLLEAIREIKSVKAVIIITTDKVYKIKKKDLPFKETDELGGKDPYSASKSCTEILVNSYIESFFSKRNQNVKISTARSGNVLGGGDYSKDRIMPDIINSTNNKDELVIRNPKHIRPWQHVIEPIHGYLKLAQYLFLNKHYHKDYSWNFGPKNNSFISVFELLAKVKNKKKIKKISFKKNNYKETKVLKLNSNKSNKYLNWKQKWNIDKTVQKILEWNSSFKGKKNMKKLCEIQIKEYLK